VNRRDERRALNTMRATMANGITDQSALVDNAAQVLGGGDDAKLFAQRVYDKHLKIMEPN